MSCKVHDYGVARLDLRIIYEVGHEVVLDPLFRSLFVQKKTYVVPWYGEALCQPPLHVLSIILA